MRQILEIQKTFSPSYWFHLHHFLCLCIVRIISQEKSELYRTDIPSICHGRSQCHKYGHPVSPYAANGNSHLYFQANQNLHPRINLNPQHDPYPVTSGWAGQYHGFWE